jgi:adenylyl-sulfate kinase
MSTNVTWQDGHVERSDRSEILGRGATVWLTGLPCSGKSTLAALLEARLIEAGRAAYRLDGDNLRHGLNSDLGFSAADRSENVRRAGHVARLFADAGVIAVVCLISPYSADRALARSLHEQAGLPFLEVFVDAPVEECERRDAKGLYARARRGELKGFTGVDDPYERPEAPDLTVRTLEESAEHAVTRLLDALSVVVGEAQAATPAALLDAAITAPPTRP